MPDMSEAALDPLLLEDVLAERAALATALLDAAPRLARGQEPAVLLRILCDALTDATAHIRLAWMTVSTADAQVLTPQYAVGPATGYAQAVALDNGPHMSRCPTRLALATGQAQLAAVPDDRFFSAWRALAANHGIAEILSFPLELGKDQLRAVITLYADVPGYFRRIGTEIFSAFTRLGQELLQQAMLRSQLEAVESFDSLTGLLSRRAIQDIAELELARCHRHRRPLALLLFNLDRFKLINDGFGHQQGDAVLKQVAQLARTVLRKGDFVGRWSGGEILCLLPDADEAMALDMAERLRLAVADMRVRLGADAVQVSISAGIAAYPGDGESLHALLAAADAALYEAKAAGRNRVMGANRLPQRLFRMGSTLDTALRDGRIAAAYQPIVELASGRVVADEALARLQEPEGGVLDACHFMDAATRLQLAHRVDYAVFLHALSRCWSQMQAGSALKHFINISGDLMRHPELVEDMLRHAKNTCPACADNPGLEKPIVIEITERELLGDAELARELLMPFLDFGFRLALDDFGSGYSSFQYLADLPFTYLKIEGSLVRRVQEPRVRAILQGIQNTASDLGLITLAEFIEDEATAEQLRRIGVDWGQGHYFGGPVLEEGR
ncbi:MAG: EAL domain-containing protein [Pseudomonadota bacterium]|uniref:GGDEF and EAL domain-containing protein n=1 Tax=Thermithiobacillus tepidarius TaxID=929 RepID=UPI00040CEE40|nr:GGDEF and EAL domain-containing protein [Thermithiobacillus tepidarius]